MLKSVAQVTIERPERYGKQLASHLAHKIQTQEIENGWLLTFPNGEATLIATGTALTISVMANDSEAQNRMQFVLDKHLRQFTSKLPEITIEWQNA